MPRDLPIKTSNQQNYTIRKRCKRKPFRSLRFTSSNLTYVDHRQFYILHLYHEYRGSLIAVV